MNFMCLFLFKYWWHVGLMYPNYPQWKHVGIDLRPKFCECWRLFLSRLVLHYLVDLCPIDPLSLGWGLGTCLGWSVVGTNMVLDIPATLWYFSLNPRPPFFPTGLPILRMLSNFEEPLEKVRSWDLEYSKLLKRFLT